MFYSRALNVILTVLPLSMTHAFNLRCTYYTYKTFHYSEYLLKYPSPLGLLGHPQVTVVTADTPGRRVMEPTAKAFPTEGNGQSFCVKLLPAGDREV